MNKYARHHAIRELLSLSSAGNGHGARMVSSQEELRQKLAGHGFAVTQATLSRDIREMNLMKGPNGYALPVAEEDDEDAAPSLVEILGSFALRVRVAQNQVVVITTMGGAQPVAAAIDHEALPEVVGTIAGDDTVLVICPDTKYAARLRERLAVWIG